MSSEAQLRKEIIDLRLKEAGWNVSDRTQVIEEFFVSRGSGAVLREDPATYDVQREFSDYVLLGKNGKPLAVVEAKKSSKDAEIGREQAKQYCVNIQIEQGGELPFCFYTNGHDIFFWSLGEAPPQKVHGFPTRQDLERLLHLRKHKKPLTSELINTTIAGRDYQLQAIRSVMEGIAQSRRQFLLVMATGTGKTRTCIALVDALMRAGVVQRTLFLVDRIALRGQALDAFKEHIPDEPRWPEPGEKTITTDRRIYVVSQLIEAARSVPLVDIAPETALRWTLTLLWFTAAADRRVKDRATRAATLVLRAKPEIALQLIDALLSIDDDEVRERTLLSIYGALLLNPDSNTLGRVAKTVMERYLSEPQSFQNALLRDHIRCLAELAAELDCLETGFNPLAPTRRQRRADWPLRFPTDSEIEKWVHADGAVGYVARSCLHDDFNHYTIGCLGPWMANLTKPEIGAWLVNHIVKDMGLAESDCDAYDQYITAKEGGGRAKPVWAERIGKKYQWIALYRLASRLHDKVKAEADSWEPDPIRRPLILLEERKLDPTLTITVAAETGEDWWIHERIDLHATKELSFANWVAKRDDLPSFECLLEISDFQDQRWQLLTAYPSWGEFDPHRKYGDPYRDSWIHINSYLIPDADMDATIEALDERNYFGLWLPTEGKWLSAFAGEYPFGSSYNVLPDWYLGADEKIRDTSLKAHHASNHLLSEWTYDPMVPTSLYLQAPSKPFFTLNDLWWNGIDGFTAGDRTVFFDPSLRFGGKHALLADAEYLNRVLKTLKRRLVWTMLGEKRILGEQRVPKKSGVCFSQLAWLTDSGEIAFGKRTYYEQGDYEKNQGVRKGRRE